MLAPRTGQDLIPPSATQESFAGGMRDRDHPSLLDPNQYAYSKNCELRDSGLMKMRGGRSTKTNALGGNPQGGVWYKDNSGNEYIVSVNGGRTYYWQGSGLAWTQIGATVFNNASTNVGFAILNGTLYISPGQSDNQYSWTGGAATLLDEGNTNADGPRCTLLCQQAGRLISGGEAAPRQDYLEFSDIFDGHTWDRTVNTQRTPTDGSEPITALATYRKIEVLAFTPFSTHNWTVSGATVSAFTRVGLDVKVGCIAPRSLVVVGDDAFFMSADRQIRTIKRTVNDLAFGVTNPITYFVPNLFDRINPSYASRCAGIYFNNYYLLACPLDTNVRNSGIIPFDTLHQFATPSGNAPVCVGEWTNMAVNQFIVSYFGGVAKLYFIDDNDGSLKQIFDDSQSDDGTAIDAQIDMRAFDYGAPNHQKIPTDGEFQFTTSSGTATLYFQKDDAVWITLGSKTIGGTGAVLPVFLPFFLDSDSGVSPWIFSMYRQGRSKYWQMRLAFSGSNMSLKQMTMRAQVENFVTR